MEGVEVIQFGNCYAGKRVLVTGHTGFKGSWLTLWLEQLGAVVAGIAMDPESEPNHFNLLDLRIDDRRLDIRVGEEVTNAIEDFRPEVVFHLAAQPLVRRSYRQPVFSWATNVMGTAHVLEACRKVGGVKAIVAITTDKVYENREWCWGYREEDRLGGHDPYSASKAASELLVASYRNSYWADGNTLLATARAGNVIGGGDWSEDRLFTDLVRSAATGKPMLVRSPNATRPWQHVLDCLAGYLLLGQKLLGGNDQYADAWNFGPCMKDNRTVAEILDKVKVGWPRFDWRKDEAKQPHEASLLFLDHSKAYRWLDWRPVWNLDCAIQATVEWYRQYLEQGVVLSKKQLAAYIETACAAGLSWCTDAD